MCTFSANFGYISTAITLKRQHSIKPRNLCLPIHRVYVGPQTPGAYKFLSLCFYLRLCSVSLSLCTLKYNAEASVNARPDRKPVLSGNLPLLLSLEIQPTSSLSLELLLEKLKEKTLLLAPWLPYTNSFLYKDSSLCFHFVGAPPSFRSVETSGGKSR